MDFDDLVRQTAQDLFDGTAVVFLGAGASMGDDSERAAGMGVPGSGELTEAVVKRFNLDPKEASTLRRAASLAVRKRDPSTVKRFVVDRIRPRCGVPLKAQRALARVAPKMVMTTNYDDLYEAAMREAGKPLERVVRSDQLAGLPQDRPRILKLHGDIESADGIVLTGPDYRRWQREARGLKARVVATLQENTCVFVGYGVGDENLHDILNIIEENQGASSLKHFALVRDVDQGLVAEWEGTVEFVRGDATTFSERVAEEYVTLGRRPLDPSVERANFERQLEAGELSGAGETCERLAEHLRANGDRAAAGALWRSFGEAAQSAGEHGAAAAALREAGQLLLEAGYPLDAEPILFSALSEAEVAGEPLLQRETIPLLQKARLSTGRYDDVLRDTERALQTYGGSAPASLTYALRAARAEAREATEGIDGAQEELEAAFRELPAEALYFRVRAVADLARVLCEKFDWDGAHDVLNVIGAEISNSWNRLDGDELRRCAAIQKLVRANVHFAVGEDAYASMHYQECAPVLEELGETGFAVSALQGIVACVPFLGYFAGDDTTARLRDLVRASDEQRRCTDLQRQGIEYLAEDKLAAARNSLIQAEAAANALHSPTRPRSVRAWFADVLVKAGFSKEALLLYAELGDRDKIAEVTESLREDIPQSNAELSSLVERLLELATKGPRHAQGASLVALGELWDVLPEGALPEIADHLVRLPEMPNLGWADRNVLPDAAELARTLVPRFSEEQAERIGAAAVAVIEDNLPWTSHKAACLALAAIAGNHTGVTQRLNVPVDRLAELVDGDVLNDTRKALMALVNLGLAGHAESRRKALELLDGADLYSRVSWRQILGEASEEELASATHRLLPGAVSRVRNTGNAQHLGIGVFTAMFLWKWDLPDSVRSEVAVALSEAVADPSAALTHRQAAALVLGHKARQFDEGDRRRIVEALKGVLTRPFEAHPMLMSTDNPLSMLRMNMGQPDDVIAAAAEALLAFSPWLKDEGERRSLRREIERLRSSQVEALGIGVADGLANFEAKDKEEERWLRTRLLLLLNSHHPKVRQSAARSLATLVKREAAAFDAELMDTVLHLSAADLIGDRVAAASALSTICGSSSWNHDGVVEALRTLREDASYLVRRRAQLDSVH